jgi:hypothetical protein
MFTHYNPLTAIDRNNTLEQKPEVMMVGNTINTQPRTDRQRSIV